MKIIHGINNIGKIKKPVVALGVFDGVHRGHRRILKAAAHKAHTIGGTSVVLTFCPHPQKQASLYSLEHRLRLIAELGIDICVVINFTGSFAGIPAEDFIKNILAGRIGAKYVYVGKDFRFGRKAQGDFNLLKIIGEDYGFKGRGINIIKVQGRAISSTLIRRLIKRGDIGQAERLLSRPVSILGTVIKGTAVGRILGFPTANINPHHEVIPAAGIYAVRIIFGGDKLKGACYIGQRPTLELKNKKVHIEVHIFNFKKNIYGKYLEIQFAKMVRTDRRFASLALLAGQIKKDIVLCKRILA
ncbi:MAG: riboflavin biosynthesis protein RibF [Candidatus Omnitrophica bacterium]|nr:riboflavin biosynthesis protein RibF [Candidatus Omnitrophota bacterium]MDD5518182.1 riboflavin biosynthesis protein RibF [Candidatus Omnitrophota bacterium]